MDKRTDSNHNRYKDLCCEERCRLLCARNSQLDKLPYKARLYSAYKQQRLSFHLVHRRSVLPRDDVECPTQAHHRFRSYMQ